MEASLINAEYPLERHTSNASIKKNKKKRITHAQNSYKTKYHHHRKYFSNKNNLIKIHSFDYSEKSSSKKDCKSNNINILDPNYKKNLFEKFSLFLDKNKFKLSNNFDAKNSKKFLDKKDKYLSKIILSDEIENEKNNDDSVKKISKGKKSKFKTQKNVHQYFIVISNYDEDLKNKTNIKTSLNLNDICKE
jgi:hypothetical protein